MPALNLAALTQQIEGRRLAPVYVLVGEDVRLAARMADAIEGTIEAADRPFAVDRVYAAEAGGSPVDIVAAARMLPMLGDRRIVVVLRAERFLKPRRASRAAAGDSASAEGDPSDEPDLSPLEEYIAAPAAASTVVFVAAEMDRSRRFTKKLLAAASIVEFGGLAAGGPTSRRDVGQTALAWVQQDLVRSGRPIDADAARLLVSRAAGDITKLRGDVERLLLYTEGRTRIVADDVMEVVAEEPAVDDDWAVVNAIADGDRARALLETGRRMERGDSPHQLVGQLRWWVSSRLAESDPGRVRTALDAILRTDLALKSSGGEERVLIERLVVELTGRPVQAPRGWGGRR